MGVWGRVYECLSPWVKGFRGWVCVSIKGVWGRVYERGHG